MQIVNCEQLVFANVVAKFRWAVPLYSFEQLPVEVACRDVQGRTGAVVLVPIAHQAEGEVRFSGSTAAEEGDHPWADPICRRLHESADGACHEAIFCAGNEAERGGGWRAELRMR